MWLWFSALIYVRFVLSLVPAWEVFHGSRHLTHQQYVSSFWTWWQLTFHQSSVDRDLQSLEWGADMGHIIMSFLSSLGIFCPLFNTICAFSVISVIYHRYSFISSSLNHHFFPAVWSGWTVEYGYLHFNYLIVWSGQNPQRR